MVSPGTVAAASNSKTANGRASSNSCRAQYNIQEHVVFPQTRFRPGNQAINAWQTLEASSKFLGTCRHPIYIPRLAGLPSTMPISGVRYWLCNLSLEIPDKYWSCGCEVKPTPIVCLQLTHGQRISFTFCKSLTHTQWVSTIHFRSN